MVGVAQFSTMAYLDDKGLSHLVTKLKTMLSSYFNKVETIGSGNAITDVTIDGNKLTFKRNTTFATTNNNITVDSALSSTSTNPVQNKVVYTALNGKASTTHSHNITSLDNVSITLKNTTTGGWSAISDDYAKGTWLKVVKGANSAPAWYAQKYASGLAFGVGDIKGVLSLSNSLAKVCFASGGTAQGTPSWYFTLTGTKEEEYNLDNIPTGKMAAQAELSSSASLTTVINKVNAIIKALKAAGIMNS